MRKSHKSFRPTHLRTTHGGWGAPKEVELISTDGILAVIRQNVATYFEKGPRYEFSTCAVSELTPVWIA